MSRTRLIGVSLVNGWINFVLLKREKMPLEKLYFLVLISPKFIKKQMSYDCFIGKGYMKKSQIQNLSEAIISFKVK